MALTQTQTHRFIDFRDQRLRYDSGDDEDDEPSPTYSLSMPARDIGTSDSEVEIDADQPVYIPLDGPKLNRNNSFGNSWGVSSIGRGFDWDWRKNSNLETQTDDDAQGVEITTVPLDNEPAKEPASDDIPTKSLQPIDIGRLSDKRGADTQDSAEAEERNFTTPPSAQIRTVGNALLFSQANGVPQPPPLFISTDKFVPLSPSPSASPSPYSAYDQQSPQEDARNSARPPPLAQRSQSLYHLPTRGNPAPTGSGPAATQNSEIASSNASTIVPNARSHLWSRPVSPSQRSPSLPLLTSSTSAPMLATLASLALTPFTPGYNQPVPRSPRLNRSRQAQKRISLIAGREVSGPSLLGVEEDEDGATDDAVSEGWLSFGGGRSRRDTPAASGYTSPRPFTPPNVSPIEDDDDPTPIPLSRVSPPTSPTSSSGSAEPDSFVGRDLQIKSLGRLGSEHPHPPTPLRLASQGGLNASSTTSIPSLRQPFSPLGDNDVVASPFPDEKDEAKDEVKPQYPSLDVPGPGFSLARLSSSWSIASGARPHSHTPSMSSKAARQSQSRSNSRDAVVINRKRLSSEASDARKGGFLGGKTIDDYVILGEAGRGAYGLVKRARERRKKELVIGPDGEETLVGDFPENTPIGPPLIIKQIIKSRILADCWKKHPIHGTIPIEIFVMSALSGTSYVLPRRRSWDPNRFKYWEEEEHVVVSGGVDHSISPEVVVQLPPMEVREDDPDANPLDGWAWREGDLITGHPNICPLDDFFEDHHYYYLVLPATKPSFPRLPNGTPCAVGANGKTPNDLFDLVELYPEGLPSPLIRSFLGQIADALSFLHARGICHRDIKDENVVLGENGRCWLIDFGSSGVVKKHGWDSFSGTLDYAAPEILHGARYAGPPQDVWAFGIVAYVLLTGECPFSSASEAAAGLEDPEYKAAIGLRQRCSGGPNGFAEGCEKDGGGCLGDAMELVRRCLDLNVAMRPTMEEVLTCRYLNGGDGWGLSEVPSPPQFD